MEELGEKLTFDADLHPFYESFLQLKLFGYVVYRKKQFGIEVLSGTDVILMRNPKLLKIIPVFTHPFKNTKNWHVTIAGCQNLMGGALRYKVWVLGRHVLSLRWKLCKSTTMLFSGTLLIQSRQFTPGSATSLNRLGNRHGLGFAMHSQMVPSSITGTMDFSTLIRAAAKLYSSLTTLLQRTASRKPATVHTKAIKNLLCQTAAK